MPNYPNKVVNQIDWPDHFEEPGRDFFKGAEKIEFKGVEKPDLPIMNIQEEFDSLFDKKYERLMEERYGNNLPKTEVKSDRELGKLLDLPIVALGKIHHESKNKVKINNVEKYLMD
jgi:hypothetical protein